MIDTNNDIFTIMEQKFTSGNQVPVTVSRITLDEWQRLKELVDELGRVQTENYALRSQVAALNSVVEKREESNIELVEALEDAVFWNSHDDDGYRAPWFRCAEKAIAKAKGETG